MKFCSPGGFNSGEQFYQYLKDAFDVLYAEGELAPKWYLLVCTVVF